ncbi:MAG TPA: metal-dependent phosphohydrolase [Actinospica sp.]|nr:metal-dependent phosphohydrolase [Actinospica sp.]
MIHISRWLAALDAPEDAANNAAYRDLVARYTEPHRRYHDLRHLTEVLDGVDDLADEAADADAVRLAAWFHDAVYAAVAEISNEEASARLAERILPELGVSPSRAAEVARLVRLTEKHAAAEGDRNASVLFDADLAILAASPARYEEYARAVRAEYAAVPDDVFRPARADILSALLDSPTLYRTASARARFEEPARANMTAEIAALRS